MMIGSAGSLPDPWPCTSDAASALGVCSFDVAWAAGAAVVDDPTSSVVEDPLAATAPDPAPVVPREVDGVVLPARAPELVGATPVDPGAGDAVAAGAVVAVVPSPDAVPGEAGPDDPPLVDPAAPAAEETGVTPGQAWAKAAAGVTEGLGALGPLGPGFWYRHPCT
jgi:hypothetical protein